MADLTISQLASPSGEMPDAMGSNTASASIKSAPVGGQSQQPQQPSDDDLANEVNTKYTRWRSDRRPLEAQWFYSAALIRGLFNVKFNPVLNILENRKVPSHRSRDPINIILPKVKAKLSKFLQSRPIPVVQAASTDHEDILNAKATTKVLEYLWDKLMLEEKYEEALLWSMQTGKAFWWFRWDESKLASVKAPPDALGKTAVVDVQLGDVSVELGTAFEMLVSDPGITRLVNQPEIMRVKTVLTADLEKQFQLPQGSLTPEIKESDLFQYQRQIATLGAKAITGMSSPLSGSDPDEKAKYSVRKELFTAPNAMYPNGRYIVVAAGKVLNKAFELPYGLATASNPYPVVEFADTLTAGQFWPTTMVEQLAPIQTQRNRVRNRLDENLKLHTHPKLFIPQQARVAKDAWDSEAGEKIPYNFQPGMPYPQQWIVQPPPISADVWRFIQMLDTEADKVTNLYPATMGAEGASSGFDTNLLQEAADSVHAPDIRRNELALRGAAYIMRRIAKLGYDVQRLITINGRDNSPDVFEFSSDQIDEHANIVIDTGSALPNQKHARIEAILKLDERQAFGPIGDPNRNRKLLRMLQLGTQDEEAALVGRDDDHARLENLSFTRGEPVEDPMPWENHDIEYDVHTDLLKSPEIKNWPPAQRAALVRHVILHVKFKNPQSAMQLAAMFGMQDVLQEIQNTMMVQQQVAAQAAAAQQPPQPPQQGGQQPAQPPQVAHPQAGQQQQAPPQPAQQAA